ncbi:hypothetical protein CRG98_039778 [Punica granatum]|uniref:Uncharacterized protein n=1 Tax=Punica granatum TaxID=22663 RepID=A0A2I0I790_PUNGR|nr:hypothetical protein CRG98_039778 [Punica granatum]
MQRGLGVSTSRDAQRTHVRRSRHLLFYDSKVEGRQVTRTKSVQGVNRSRIDSGSWAGRDPVGWTGPEWAEWVELSRTRAGAAAGGLGRCWTGSAAAGLDRRCWTGPLVGLLGDSPIQPERKEIDPVSGTRNSEGEGGGLAAELGASWSSGTGELRAVSSSARKFEPSAGVCAGTSEKVGGEGRSRVAGVRDREAVGVRTKRAPGFRENQRALGECVNSEPNRTRAEDKKCWTSWAGRDPVGWTGPEWAEWVELSRTRAGAAAGGLGRCWTGSAAAGLDRRCWTGPLVGLLGDSPIQPERKEIDPVSGTRNSEGEGGGLAAELGASWSSGTGELRAVSSSARKFEPSAGVCAGTSEKVGGEGREFSRG